MQAENHAVQKDKVKKVIKALQVQVKKLKQEKEDALMRVESLEEEKNNNINNVSFKSYVAFTLGFEVQISYTLFIV